MAVKVDEAGSHEPPRYGPSLPWLGRIHPYFKDPEHVLVLKLDILLLVWAFIAGLLKDMDQSGTTQAYVSGMKEALSLYGNELVEFTTYFSIGYAIFIVPSQMIQTRIRPSLFLPICEIIWGAVTLATYKAPNAKTGGTSLAISAPIRILKPFGGYRAIEDNEC